MRKLTLTLIAAATLTACTATPEMIAAQKDHLRRCRTLARVSSCTLCNNCRGRQNLSGRSLPAGDASGHRLPGAQPARRAVPPVGDLGAERVV